MGKETLYLRLGRMGWNETEKKAKGFPKDRTQRAKAGPWKKSAHVKRTMTIYSVMRWKAKPEEC